MVLLEASILKRVVIPLLIGWATILASVYSFMIFIKKELTDQAGKELHTLKLDEYNNLFLSKSS